MSLADRFVGLGFAADDAESRAALIEAVSQGFQALTGAPPTWRWFVPGRLEVPGKHTDYAGGPGRAGAGTRRDGRVRWARRGRRGGGGDGATTGGGAAGQPH